jgi:hypothetical protein
MTHFEAWACPSCGRRFARANTQHVCEHHSVKAKLEIASPEVRALYQGLHALAGECGEFFEEATKTAIEFKTPRTFLVLSLKKKFINCTIWLGHPLYHRRIRHNYPVANQYAIHFQIKGLGEIDTELKSWLCESYFFQETA